MSRELFLLHPVLPLARVAERLIDILIWLNGGTLDLGPNPFRPLEIMRLGGLPEVCTHVSALSVTAHCLPLNAHGFQIPRFALEPQAPRLALSRALSRAGLPEREGLP